jgi:hypothetical protein
MKYLKAYLKAFLQIAACFGVLHFILGIFSFSPLAHYFLYVSAVAGLAGPIGEAVKK